MNLKATVLIDNTCKEGLLSEWGLSFYIEHCGRRYLLDTGATDKFIINAERLGIDLSSVDCAVLSHAHYDHSGGTEAFLKLNTHARLYVRPSAGENCWSRHSLRLRYIGLPKGLLDKAGGRLVRKDGVVGLGEGAWLVPHSYGAGTAWDPRISARKSGLYVRRGLCFVPDDFSHEQSLVFETDEGLVIFNSCSHSGPEAIVAEVMAALPGRKICAYIGGLHLFRLRDKDIESVASGLAGSGVARVFAGHCTGDRAYAILESRLEGRIGRTYSGMTVSFG